MFILGIFRLHHRSFPVETLRNPLSRGFRVSAQIGNVVAPAFGRLRDHIGYQPTFFVISGVVFVAGLWAYFALKHDDQDVLGDPFIRDTAQDTRSDDDTSRRHESRCRVACGASPDPATYRGCRSIQLPAAQMRIHEQPALRAARNWVNDPNGLIHHNGRYHLYFRTTRSASTIRTSVGGTHRASTWSPGRTIRWPSRSTTGAGVLGIGGRRRAGTTGFGNPEVPTFVALYLDVHHHGQAGPVRRVQHR